MLIPNSLASSPHRALAVRFAAPLLCAISITLAPEWLPNRLDLRKSSTSS
jgi:hypothetical protein